MSEADLERLYDKYALLSQAGDHITKHSEDYLDAVAATKGDDKVKKLAAQIIAKFFKHFPQLQQQAYDAVIDLCEDTDSTVRMAAIKSLPLFCKENPAFVSKVADILTQLLQLPEQQDYNVVSSGLLQLMRDKPLAICECLFKQIISDGDAEGKNKRENIIKFLVSKLKPSDNVELENFIVSETKKVLQDVSCAEYKQLFPFLASTRISTTIAGQKELLDIAAEQAEIMVTDFNPLDTENEQVDRLLICLKLILPYVSKSVETTKFVEYICDQVLPQWEKIGTLKNGEDFQLMIACYLAQLSTHCGKLGNASANVVHIFQKLKDYMPSPSPSPDTDETAMPDFDFSTVECFLYAFHQLARQCPDFLTHDPLVLKDFRARLLYLARGVQSCVQALKKPDAELPEKHRNSCPKLFSNLNVLIKDLFYQPPMYKCKVALSFLSAETSPKTKVVEIQPAPVKRHVPITFDSNGTNSKQVRTNRADGAKLYTPPSGKFSNNFRGYGSSRGRGGRGGRGGGRGRPNWRN